MELTYPKSLSSLTMIASFLILLCIGPHLTNAQSLQAQFQKLRINNIPITSSTSTIKFRLNGNIVKPGDPVPAKNFRQLDIMEGVMWEPQYSDGKYTLMLLDLDRKHGQNGTEVYNQYTNLNIPGALIANGQAIVAFDPPSVPCQQSAKHRLVILAFRQAQNIDIADVAYISAPAGYSPRREDFKLDNFIERHRLTLEAANVFYAMGEINGVCSAGTTIGPPILTIISIMFALLTLQRVLSRN